MSICHANFINIRLRERTDKYKLKYHESRQLIKIKWVRLLSLYCSPPSPLSLVAKNVLVITFFFEVFRNSTCPHVMYRSLRVKMFEIDPPGRFLFAAGKCTAHFEQDVAQVSTLSRFALCFLCCHLRFSSKRRYVDTGFLYMVIK